MYTYYLVSAAGKVLHTSHLRSAVELFKQTMGISAIGTKIVQVRVTSKSARASVK